VTVSSKAVSSKAVSSKAVSAAAASPVMDLDANSPIPIIQPWLGDEEVDAAATAIRSGWIAQGPNVAAVEREFAALVGAVDAVAVSSCTTALHLALVVLGIGPGDDVIVPSLSFIATTNAVRYVGATPVFADVDVVTGNVTPETVASAFTPATAAVIVVDQAGMPADVAGIRTLCEARGVSVVEDAACAIGSTHRGRLVGSGAQFVAFSFHPRKLVTCGEGGMLTVDDPDVAARLRRLREHGMSVSAADRHRADRSAGDLVFEEYQETGFNYRMTDVQAAILRVQLGRLKEMVERRRLLAARYHAAIDEIVGLRAVCDPPDGTTNYQSFWVLIDERFGVSRNEVMARCLERGISTRRGIMAAHLEPACASFVTGPLPATETITHRSVILPLYHSMTEGDQDRVIRVLQELAR
jgi:dTDP-4-amino-4,6-dideoxygalactose transaminase